MHFADGVEDPAKQLVVPSSPRQWQGLVGARQRLLPLAELDIDERNRIQGSRLFAEVLRAAPIGTCCLKMADGLQHLCAGPPPVCGCRQRNFASRCDASSMTVRRRAQDGERDLVTSGWSM